MMANGTTTANPPPSALIASAFSPTPLEPHLTTLSTSHEGDGEVPVASPPTGASIPLSSQSAVVESLIASDPIIAADVGIAARPRAVSSNPHRLLQRNNQPTATQALNVTSTHSTSPFPAYLPARRIRDQGESSAFSSSHATKPVEDGRQGRSSSDKLLDARLRQSGSQQVPSFAVIAQFRADSDFRGDVLIRCSAFDFYVHRSILYFASPFFRAILDGDWQESHPSLYAGSAASAVSDSDPFTEASSSTAVMEDDEAPGPEQHTTSSEPMSHESLSLRADVTVYGLEGSEARVSGGQDGVRNVQELANRLERMATPPLPDDLLEGLSDTLAIDRQKAAHKRQREASVRRRGRMNGVTAVIDLTDEDESTFQDVLCHIYPNLDLVVTWLNIFPLFSFSDKFAVPYLRRACTTFLRASLAGRPIEAMALGERHGIDDVYREASRHVLDNMPSWSHDELAVLTSDTLLKLERKRTWFLERLLKLGLANPARGKHWWQQDALADIADGLLIETDYECHSACPDQNHCSKVLHERWHAQYASAFKYGPPQPSIIWRHLREMEGLGSPSHSMTMSACQASSKAWVQSLFDRMYGLPSHGKVTQKFLSIKLGQEDANVRLRTARIYDSEA